MQKSSTFLYFQIKKHASSCPLSKTQKGYVQCDFPRPRTRLVQLANPSLSTSPKGDTLLCNTMEYPKGRRVSTVVEALVERGGFSVAPSKTELATGHFKYNQFLNFQLSTFFKTYKIEKQINNYKEFKNQIHLNTSPKGDALRAKTLSKIQGAKEFTVGGSVTPLNRGFETTTSKLKALWLLPRKEALQPGAKQSISPFGIRSTEGKTKTNPSLHPPVFVRLPFGRPKATVEAGIKRVSYKGGVKKTLTSLQSLSQKEAYNGNCQIDQGEKNQTYVFLQILLSKFFEGATFTSVESPLISSTSSLRPSVDRREDSMFTHYGASKRGLETTQNFQLHPLKGTLPSVDRREDEQTLAIYGRNPSISTWPSFFSSAAKDIGIWASLKSKGQPKQNKLFLLNKLTNKTFLSYWLIPIAGFAFFTNYKLIYNPQGLCLPTLVTGLEAVVSRNFKTNNEINKTFYKFVNYIKNKKSSSSLRLAPPYGGSTEGNPPLLSPVVSSRVLDCARYLPQTAIMEYLTDARYKSRRTLCIDKDVYTKVSTIRRWSISPECSIFYPEEPPTKHKGEVAKDYLSFIKYVKTNHNNKVELNILNSLLDLSRINPVSTNRFLKNNMNFITNKNLLKLLKIKRQKSVVLSPLGPSALQCVNIESSLRSTINIAQAEGRRESTELLLNSAKSYVHEYQNGLTLINSNFKNLKTKSSLDVIVSPLGYIHSNTMEYDVIPEGPKGVTQKGLSTSKMVRQQAMAEEPILCNTMKSVFPSVDVYTPKGVTQHKNNLGFYTIDKSKKSFESSLRSTEGKNNIILNQILTLLHDNVFIQKKNYMNFIGVEKQVITLKLNLLKTLILPNPASSNQLNQLRRNTSPKGDALLCNMSSLRSMFTHRRVSTLVEALDAFSNPLKGISVQRQKHLFSTQSIGQQDINGYFTYLKNILNIFIYLNNQQNFNSFCFVPISRASHSGGVKRSTGGFVNPQGLGMGKYYAATPAKRVGLRLKNKVHFVSSKFLQKLKNNTNQNIISVSLLLKHYKMFKLKKGVDKLAGWYITPLGVINKKNIQSLSLSKQKLTPRLYLPGEFEQKKSRLQFQKKRKAKKQRLETRRQKKRTRFFPRPIWLRNRLFLFFLNQRKVKNQKEGAFLNKTLPTSPKGDALLGNTMEYYGIHPPTVEEGCYTGRVSFYPARGTKMEAVGPRKRGLELRTKYEVPTLNKSARLPFGRPKAKLAINKGQVLMFTLKSTGYFKKSQTNLRDLKLKGNFVNFKNQKTNNSPNNDFDNDKDKDTLFRDFWIWFYNNLTFQLGNPSAFSTPIGFNFMQESTYTPTSTKGDALGVLPLWGINIVEGAMRPLTPQKGGLDVGGNLRAFLSQYGGRIAPSFYTKDPQDEWGKSLVDTKIKQVKNSFEIARIYWALNKTNTNTITEFNKRYTLWTTQKLRNQSKNNKTKYLEKQFITNWEKFFLNKNLNLFKKKIQSKYTQKKQKLNYITSYIPHNKKEVFKIKNLQNFNVSWWAAALSFKPFTSPSKYNLDVLCNSINIEAVSSNFINKEKYSLFLEPWVKANKNAFNLSSYYTDNFLIGISFLLHLCAIITLISISQVRCFIKFHLILLHKLSNGYFSLLQQLSTRVKLVPSIATRPHTNFKVLTWSPLYNTSVRPSPLGGNNSSGINKKSPVRTGRLPPVKGGRPSAKKQTKMYTFFSFNLLKKDSSLAKNSFSTRRLSKGNYIQVPTKKYERGFKGVKINQSKTIYSKINIISLKSLLILPLRGINIIQGLSFFNKSFSLPFGRPKANPLNGGKNFTSSPLASTSPSPKGGFEPWSQANFKIKTKKVTNSLFTSSKKIFFSFIMNVIDLFQLSVRNVSSFFEKPAEFTTTWIAYGFLVEWSSDLITIIPENIDIYIWNVFSKVSRNMPLFTYCVTPEGFFLPTGQVEIGRSLVGSSSAVPQSPTWDFSTLSQLAQLEGYSLGLGHKINITTLLPLTYLLQRRMFYLFDTFLFTLSQPDADLIARQEKGTLFWDIWADFLVTAADFYNVNVAALSTIKAEQTALIENISTDFPSSITQVAKRQKDKNRLTSRLPFGLRSTEGKTQCLHTKGGLKTLLGSYHSSAFKIVLDVFAPQINGSSKVYVGQQTVPYFVLRSNPSSGLGVKNSSGLFLGRSSTSKNNGNLFKPNSFTSNIQDLESASTSGGTLRLLQSSASPLGDVDVDRWAINQFITYQSWHSHNGSNNSNGDLFIDYHPPKSFTHIPAIKSNSILQQPIGTLVCQIYSGIFNKQISKNILLVFTKTKKEQNFTNYNGLLIQALAGETELKIITDSAQRYAVVNRGFAIGIKLLRDVFDAIALNTPCIFLLEDIHFIGERRPMLISDYGSGMSDDNGSFKEDFFGSQRDEVHEKNQVVYQLTRHAITHYKKPFKGDYSLSIPTNLYVTDLFLKFPTQSTSNLSIIENHNLTIKNKIKITPDQVSLRGLSDFKSGLALKIAKTPSFLRIKQTIKKIAPPNTSPFSVFLLKEEKKLKPNKIVSELPWTGLPTEQLATKPRTSYSIRAKVAMLAELSLSNLSAKLDMITDLLVIIDSVRSNKGFVVFATTNVPHLLDPALRRPGRLDETICLPNISNSTELIFNTNIEIIKSIQRFPSVTRLGQLAKEPKSPLSHSHTLKGTHYYDNTRLPFGLRPPTGGRPKATTQNTILTVNLKDYSIILGMAMKQTTIGLHIPKYSENFSLNYALISHSKKLKHKKQKLIKDRASCQPGAKELKTNLAFGLRPSVNRREDSTINIAQAEGKTRVTQYNITQSVTQSVAFGRPKGRRVPSSFITGPSQKKLKAIAYYEVGKVILNYYLTNNLLYGTRVEQRLKPQGDFLNLKSINFLSLYGSKNKIIHRLMSLFSGKISQLLSVKTKSSLCIYPKGEGSLGHKQTAMPRGMHPRRSKLAFGCYAGQDLDFDMSQIFEHNENFKLATTLMLSFIHKRYLYRKNLIVPKLLSFTDGNVLEEPPCPPFSSLLIPAKRFENYKRVFHDILVGDKIGQRKTQISFMDKLQSHIKSYYIKQLNNLNQLPSVDQREDDQEPLITAESIAPGVSNTSSRSLEDVNSASAVGGKKTFLVCKHRPKGKRDVDGLGGGVAPSKYGALLAYGDLVSEQIPTNINWYYQNRILKRHGQYLTNQWWNGHLSEHNSETVFLSDIDWRSSFIKNKQINLKIKKLYQLTASNPLLGGSVSDPPFTVSAKGNNSSSLRSTEGNDQLQNIDGLDVLLDFPDTDQFYNPRRRRWLLNRNYWNFWFNFDKVYSEKIISTWILESIIKTYNYLHNNTELLDFVTNKFLCLGYPNLESLDKNSSLSLNNNLEAYSKTQINAVKEIILTNSFKRF